MHTKTIGLIAHTGKRGVAELINSIAEEFERFSISILFEKETARVAGKQRGYPVAELGGITDLLVVAGIAPAGIKGADGNQEFFACIRKRSV